MRKKCITMLLALVMVVSLFAGVVPTSAAAADSDGFTYSQKETVSEDATGSNVSDSYKAAFPEFTAHAVPSGIIPGLQQGEEMIPQSMGYYPQKGWMLIGSYNESKTASYIFAIDMSSGKMVAEYELQTPDGSKCTYHVGGLAVGKCNLYVTSTKNGIVYVPLDELTAGHKTLQFKEELKVSPLEANTSYANVSDGVLWLGNFYNNSDGYNTKASADYNSMAFGYALSGTTSDEEWSNLKASIASPTYALALTNGTYDQLQGLAITNGRIYLSSSYGRTNNSKLYVFDLDLTAAADSTKSAPYVLDQSKLVKMVSNLPLSEALCMADGYLYCLYESGAYKFNGGEKTKCTYPTDQIWKIDPYSLIGAVRPSETVTSVWYEKVTTIADAKQPNSEYIICYEDTKTGKIYAIDANGLLKVDGTASGKGNESLAGTSLNYTKDGDRIFVTNVTKTMRWGITGGDDPQTQPIYIKSMDTQTYASNPYLYVGSRLIYMNNSNANTQFEKMRLMESDDGEHFNIYLDSKGDGTFDKTKDYFLWCDDGQFSDKYGNEAAGTFHADLFRVATDGNTGNHTGLKTDDLIKNCSGLGNLTIYKRVSSSTSQTQVGKSGTNLTKTAELQPDGTYRLDLSAYTTGQTTYTDEDMSTLTYVPTDFVFVLDLSGSMADSGTANGYVRESTTDWTLDTAKGKYYKDQAGNYHKVDYDQSGEVYVSYEANLKHNGGDTKDPGYTGTLSNQSFSITGDGVLNGGKLYYPNGGTDAAGNPTYSEVLYDVHGDSGNKKFGVVHGSNKYYYNLHYVDSNGHVQYLGDTSKYSSDNISYAYCYTNHLVWSDSNDTQTLYKKQVGNRLYYMDGDQKIYLGAAQASGSSSTAYKGYLYSFTSMTGLEAMQSAVNDCIEQIARAKTQYGADYRISIVTYANDNAMGTAWENTGTFVGTSRISYPKLTTDDYNSSLQSADSANLTQIVNGLKANGGTATDKGMLMAQNVLKSTGRTYNGKDNQACVILFTDGIPGTGKSGDSANNYGNRAIQTASEIAQTYSGADVYSIGLGVKTLDNFNGANFLNYLSSNYPNAQSMSNPGTKAADKYYQNTVDGSTLNSIFTSISSEYTRHDTDKFTAITLNADSILKDTGTDAFDWSNASVTLTFAPGTTANGLVYDFALPISQTEFERATSSEVKCVLDGDKLTITGYDYSSQFISMDHPGYKMIVTVDNLLLKDGESGEAIATNTDDSGIYENASSTEATNKFEVPTVNVPEQSYTLDFGLPATAELDRTVVALSTAPSKQNISAYSTTIDGQGKDVKVDVAEGKKGITMSPYTNWGDVQRNYALTVTADGTYEWVKLSIIPASNILYEEDKLTLGSEDGKVAWTTVGSAAARTQTIDNNLRYGYDDVYTSDLGTYGNGTAYAATVNKNSKFSQSLSFQFTGTGFDIISDCSNKTGILAAAVKNSSGETIKAYIVDTYFKGDAQNTIAHGTTLYQTPVVQNLALDYGTYTVTMNAMYLKRSEIEKAEASADTFSAGNSAVVNALLAQAGMTDVDPAKVELVYMDDDSILSPKHQPSPEVFDGEEQVMDWTTYVDGVRVYGALAGKDQSVYLDSEKNVTYYNIINGMIAADKIANATANGFAYIEGTGDTTFDPATYQNNGPQNEIYLTKGHAIAFKVPVGSTVQVSARAVTAQAAQINGDKAVTSNTEMYYEVKPNSDGTVVIQSTGEGMLALVNVKIASAAGNAAPMVDLATLEEACQLLAAGTPEPPQPTEPTQPTDPSGPDAPWVNPFTDVDENDWFYDAVKFVNERQLFVGTTETTFSPRMAMTRGMFVTVLGTLAGVDEASAEASTFEDVNPTAYYAPYVAWAQKNGIVVGTTDTTFEPNAEITREQMAIIMYNYAKFAGEDVSNTDPAGLAAFADGGSVSAWAQIEMAWAVNGKLMVGSDGKLSPQNHASRAEVAEIVKNYVNVLGK